MMMKLEKLSSGLNPGTQPKVLTGVVEEGPIRMKLQTTPLLAPRWAPTVIMVNKQMSGVGLCWGRWTPEDPGRDDAMETAHGRTHEHHDVPRFRALVRR